MEDMIDFDTWQDR